MTLPRTRGGVVLRRLSVRDLADFQAYRADPDTGRWQGWRPMPDAEARAFLAEMERAPLFAPGQWCQLGIGAEGSDVLLGDVGLQLHDDGRAVQLGYTLAPAARGRGVATTAVQLAIGLVFETTSANEVRASTDTRNLRSLALLRRLGFSERARRAAEFRGEACVECDFSLARSSLGAAR